jgi:hypothetical protein
MLNIKNQCKTIVDTLKMCRLQLELLLHFKKPLQRKKDPQKLETTRTLTKKLHKSSSKEKV